MRITLRKSFLHGTGSKALGSEHQTAMDAIKVAIEAVEKVTVHGRDFDYQPGSADFSQARDEYSSQVRALKTALNFISAHWLHSKGFDEKDLLRLAESLN